MSAPISSPGRAGRHFIFRTVLVLAGLLFGTQTGTSVQAQSAAAKLRDATLPAMKLPAGFQASVYASGLAKPRLMAVAPNGDVALSDMKAGTVYLLRGTQKATLFPFASGLDTPHGLAFHGGFLYVATTRAVLRYPYKVGDTHASAPARKVVDLPAGGEHFTRTISFGPDGRLYVSAGSSCNQCRETDPRRAAVWSYTADGKDGRLYASGLRNAVGMAWKGGALYVSNNGRDYLGDVTPPESFFRLKQGGFYGWPGCFTVGRRVVNDPAHPKADCHQTVPAFATVHAHSAPMDLALYGGQMFPAAYRGKFFAALHGSSMNAVPVGDKVVSIDPATGKVQDFLSGLVRQGGYINRPVGLAVLPDGSLLVSDDWAGKVYRVSYRK